MPPHTPRRRNVVSRDRTGCNTCRARRLKCDEGKPVCNNCTRLGLRCGGYLRQVVFKDQTESLKKKHRDHETARWPRGQSPASFASRVATSTVASQSLETSPSAIDAEVPTPPPPPPPGAHLGCPSGDQSPDCTDDNGMVLDAVSTLRDVNSPVQLTPGGRGLVDHDPQELNTGSALLLPASQESGDNAYVFAQDLLGFGSQPGPSSPSSPACPAHPGRSDLIAPAALWECAMFPQDMIYYHHLRDAQPLGLLSILGLDGILEAEYLDCTFFHAALALSALDISLSGISQSNSSRASLHALEHFVTALEAVGRITESGDHHIVIPPETSSHDRNMQHAAISWLATVLLLAQFELQRGHMRPWYTHSRGAIAFLSQHCGHARASLIGRSLIRSFSRIAALLDIYDRTYSVHSNSTPYEVSNMLMNSLKSSVSPSDRLLFILPRVIQLEEDWRGDPKNEMRWKDHAQSLLSELADWRGGLASDDVPCFEKPSSPSANEEELEARNFCIQPLSLSCASNPLRAATNYMHYLVSILRLRPICAPEPDCQLLDDSEDIVIQVCRLAAGVSATSCAAANAFGHGMLPALMNAYYLSRSSDVKHWIREWIGSFPRDREGIWSVRQAARLLDYVDEEYGPSGPRAGWSIIKVRMVDLELDPHETGGKDSEVGDSDKFSVEIYAKNRRGWSIDFVEID